MIATIPISQLLLISQFVKNTKLLGKRERNQWDFPPNFLVETCELVSEPSYDLSECKQGS